MTVPKVLVTAQKRRLHRERTSHFHAAYCKKYYEGKPNELEILHGIDLTVHQGEFVSIVGESGSGKSTLMNIIGVLDRQTDGMYSSKGRMWAA